MFWAVYYNHGYTVACALLILCVLARQLYSVSVFVFCKIVNVIQS